jgi:hypothetical protein
MLIYASKHLPCTCWNRNQSESFCGMSYMCQLPSQKVRCKTCPSLRRLTGKSRKTSCNTHHGPHQKQTLSETYMIHRGCQGPNLLRILVGSNPFSIQGKRNHPPISLKDSNCFLKNFALPCVRSLLIYVEKILFWAHWPEYMYTCTYRLKGLKAFSFVPCMHALNSLCSNHTRVNAQT